MKKGYLVLENGMVFEGTVIGKPGHTGGEVVFNTSMTGYQEILTDPSYAGQIVVMTYPLIGNYGLSESCFESRGVFARGLIVKESCLTPSHHQKRWDLDTFLCEEGVMGLTGIDTRMLTRILREHGTMGGVLTCELTDRNALIEEARQSARILESNLVMQVTRSSIERFGQGKKRVVVYDFGSKKSIVDSLVARGCEVYAVPANTNAEAVMELDPEGLVLSNGPGDPRACKYAVAEVKKLLGRLPMMGICLGHQLLGLALGGNTYKLLFGHRGANHPVKDLRTQKVIITAQNHGYALHADSLAESGTRVIFSNLNDNTVEGIENPALRAFSLQFHPEANPGPEDSSYLFDEFVAML
ncbi:MAG: glutamine-hydrolyzing carbamoyl-phosphate synthase small subunit [Syntrophomonadaceae bacterium]|nr:glutamine-hydrolyzing carbamoyl-phosphate synthase small subunit [Syntrophomonadaceae bacterium]